MRIGIRKRHLALVLTSIIVSGRRRASVVWRTAQQVSQTLADTINDQIVSCGRRRVAVDHHRGAIVHDGRVRILLDEKYSTRATPGSARSFPFPVVVQPTISWVAFGWPDGSFFAGHKLGDTVIEMLSITGDGKLGITPVRIRGQRPQAQGQLVRRTPNTRSPIRRGFARRSAPTTSTGRR